MRTKQVQIDGSPKPVAIDDSAARSPPPSPLSPAPSGALQRYVLLEQIGMEAIGIVYAAYDYELDRRVAVKLLFEPREGTAQQWRLMREAKALAKLSHPNVVGVHDAGSYGDQVFIAMEHVDGRTLRRWREEAPRSLREVLAVFRAAGAGLAAAHAAGIVHRDFKPDSVLIDRQGRARVRDFGLATVSHEPAYMALEQHRGERARDPRTDQFSFAVALYESVCGVHPFEAKTIAELTDNILHGRIHAPRRGVPGWLVRALVPALAADPARRYPSMIVLLRKLRDRRPSRTGGVAAVAAVTAAVSLSLAGGRLATSRSIVTDAIREPPCQGIGRNLDGVWDELRKLKVAEAFRAASSPLADKALTRVVSELDRYTADWREMRREACVATHVDRERTEERPDPWMQVQCLDRQSAYVRELTSVLIDADSEVVEALVQNAPTLPAIEACGDTDSLHQEVRPPDARVRERAAKLRARNTRLRVQLETGRGAEALTEGRQLVAEADKLAYRPVQAEALLTLARLLWAQDDSSAAKSAFFDALVAAEAGRVPRLAVEALLGLAWVAGEAQGDHAAAHEYVQMARGKLDGIGGDDRLEALLADREGVLWLGQKQLARARPHLERGLELHEKIHGPSSPQVSASLDHLGTLAQAEHRFDDAVQLFQRARQLAEDVHGLAHSATLTYLAHEARALSQAGRYEHAFAVNQRGHAILGEDDLIGVLFLANLGLIEWKRQRVDLARAHLTRALAIIEELRGPDHPDVADAASELGLVLLDMQRLPDAITHFARAAAIYERGFGADHPDLATALLQLGRAHLAARSPDRATPLLERALSIRQRTNATAAELDDVRRWLDRARRARWL